MARRSRENRYDIPGYDESRPSRDERKKRHRASRHATNQILHTTDDPEDLVLPEERRSRRRETTHAYTEPKKRRFRVWKTSFWKRRASYRDTKAELDAEWPVITPEQLEHE